MNLIFALAFASSNAFAGTTFGGGDLGFVGEFDAAGAEALVELRAQPVELKRGAIELVWAPSALSWGIYPAEKRLDRVEVAVMEGRREFSSGKSAARFSVGEVTFDRDLGYIDLRFGEGGVELQLIEQLHLQLGVDMRLRALDARLGALTDEDVEEKILTAVLLGVPASVIYQQDNIADHFYASAQLGIRPSVGLAGDAPFVYDMTWGGELGVHILREEEADARAFLAYTGKIDTFTALEVGQEQRLTLGARVDF
ncbi:MAG: hypothetical protein IPN01_20865 [Deltaproteobacteria bacterium]|nr:hypothetical protein [Deltaproteobacteria bacterium]